MEDEPGMEPGPGWKPVRATAWRSIRPSSAMKRKKKVKLSVALSEEAKELLERAAKAKGLSRSAMMEQSVRYAVPLLRESGGYR